MAIIAFILMFAAAFFQGSNAAEYQSSTAGREFFFGVLPLASSDCCRNGNNKIPLDITNVSPNDARVRVQIPFFNNDTYFDIPAGTTKRINLHFDIQRDRSFVEARGVKVTSNYEVSVLVSNVYNNQNSIDTYNVLPVTAIGNDYIISTYSSIYASKYGGVISIAGVSNHTNVTILNSTHSLRSEVINMFDIFQYLCENCDPTGVRVISDKNVSIVAGTTFTEIPLNGRGEGDYIASEMIPFPSLARHYIVPPVLPKSAFMLKILSDRSFSVKVSNVTRTLTKTPSTAELYFGTEAVVLTATSPFSVTQYGVNYNYDKINGDPFMVATPGVDQYISEYKFNVPNGYYGPMIHYVAVIVSKLHIDGLVFDGTSLSIYNTTKSIKGLRVPAPFDNYTIMTFSVSEGFHHFFHKNEVKFGLLVYAHGHSSRDALSYAFYAGYDLEGRDRVQGIKNRMCYSCRDLYHVYLCDRVTQCGDQEVCYVDRFLEAGQKKYETGCLQKNLCETKQNDSSYSGDLCFECCSGDFCNNKGCGENGIPSRENRGPICFDCEHVSSPEECKKVTPCDSHQTCRIEEYKWFDQSHFKLGCGHGLCNPAKRTIAQDFKRATPVCRYCCSDDYCNRNCTADPSGQSESVIFGIPARENRGPICFDCEHVLSPEECKKVTPCDFHQSCRIEEYKWFDQSHFKLGCGHGLCNPAKRTIAQDFKRATPVCRYCCSDDYCNRNCTADPSGQSESVIIG